MTSFGSLSKSLLPRGLNARNCTKEREWIIAMKNLKKVTAAIIMLALVFTAAPLASALDLGDILKGGAAILGGGALVTALAPQLNDFINTLTFNKNAKYDGYTKVVPIVSIGNGTRIGAAQVGSQQQSELNRVKAVGRIEGEFSRIGLAAFVPIDSINPLQGFKRVHGAGVTAIIDVQI